MKKKDDILMEEEPEEESQVAASMDEEDEDSEPEKPRKPKTVLVPKVQNMDDYLMKHYKDYIIQELNKRLVDGELAEIVGVPVKSEHIIPGECCFRRFSYWRLNQCDFLIDIDLRVELRVETPAGVDTDFYSFYVELWFSFCEDEEECVYVDHLTEAQKKAYILADNRMAMDAGWDEELLKVELESLQEMAYDLSLTGFDEKELASYMGDDEKETQDDDFDLTAALEKATFVEPGDLWTVGRHRLLCGDATKAEDVQRLMGGKRANLIVTDPPYGVSFKSDSGLTIQNDSIKDEEFYGFLLLALKNMADALEKGGAAYVFHADTEGLNFRRAFIDAGFHLAGCCIWVKDSLVLGRSDYQWQHEPVLYGFLQNGKHPWYSDRKQTTIWNFAKPKRNENHPTSKPLDLLAYPIGNSSQENSIVLDTFGGSGSTMMACEQTNRICFMSELDPKYACHVQGRALLRQRTDHPSHLFARW